MFYDQPGIVPSLNGNVLDQLAQNTYPNPFLDIGKYTPKAPSGKPEDNPALKFWEHPSPKKVIPIREGMYSPSVVQLAGDVVPFDMSRTRVPSVNAPETGPHNVLQIDPLAGGVPQGPGAATKAGRQQIRKEFFEGKKAFEKDLPEPTIKTTFSEIMRQWAAKNRGDKPADNGLPAPKGFWDRMWDNYAKDMTPKEFLKSEALWSGAREVAEQWEIPYHHAFSEVANEIFGRMKANQYLSPDGALKYISEQLGKMRGGEGVAGFPYPMTGAQEALTQMPAGYQGADPSAVASAAMKNKLKVLKARQKKPEDNAEK